MLLPREQRLQGLQQAHCFRVLVRRVPRASHHVEILMQVPRASHQVASYEARPWAPGVRAKWAA